MITFWTACAALLVVALPFIVWPLWRGAGNTGAEVGRDAANLEILRDQMAELESDLREGMLTQEAFEQGKRELQARLLEEVGMTEHPAAPPRRSAKMLAVVLAILLPLFCVPLYLTLGDTRALSPQHDTAMAAGSGIIRSGEKLLELEEKLAQQPQDPDGWFVLARSYSELERYQDAARAYGRLVELVPGEAQLWANYADVYAMSHNQSLLGEPTRLIDKALELDGNNLMALALGGSAAMERGDYTAAIKHWTKLSSLLPPDNQELQMIRNGIQEASKFLEMQQAGQKKTPPVKALEKIEAIRGTISLSPALAGRAAPGDTVFVFARDAHDKKLLLAVLRKQVKDLPLQFVFDDSMALNPQVKLSGSKQIVVVARVSKSGEPIAQSGDLQGAADAVSPGTRGINVVVDSVVP